MNQVRVKSNLPNDQVVLWERDPAHPDGEAYIAGDTTVVVAETPAVSRLLAEKKIVKSGKQPAKPKAPKTDDSKGE